MSNNLNGRWWNNFKKEVAEIAPLSGLAGIAVGGIALVESLLLSGGAVLVVVGGSIGFAAYRSYPKPLTDPETLVGEIFSPLSSIPELTKDVPFIGVFGETKSGKSTLLKKLQLNTDRPKPTRGLHAIALRTNGSNPTVFFLLDGEGENPAEQSKICIKSDMLFFVVDHNLSDSDVRVSNERKDSHTNFLDMMSRFFEDRDGHLQKIHILLNKKDCWKKSANAFLFEQWGDSLASSVKLKIICKEITVDPHSNFETDCISSVWSKIEDFVG